MKLKTRILWGLSLGVTCATPIMAIVACNSVEGELDYKIIGLNSNGTDYIIDITVNKQFIAKIIEKNRNNLKVLDEKIKAKVLASIKNIFPPSYQNGEFKNFPPALKTISKTQFQVLIPIKKVVSNLPLYSKIKSDFANKYKKKQAISEKKEKLEDEIFMPKLQSLKGKLQDFLTKKYDDISSSQGLAKKDYVNFNYMGIMPYMAGKLTNHILKSVLGLKTYANVDELLAKKFQDKKDQEQIKETTTLPNTFEIIDFRGKQMDVFFYITNIQEEDPSSPSSTSKSAPSEKQYKLKDKTIGFDSTKNNKADVYFSLFLKKELVTQKTAPVQVVIEDKFKIEKTKVADIFNGLKVGTQFSRVVEVDTTKDHYGFDHDKLGKEEEVFQAMIASQLFTKEIKKDDDGKDDDEKDDDEKDDDEKVEDKKDLYIAKLATTYKAVMTFDIIKIEAMDASKQWVVKAPKSIVKKGDRVTYANYKIEYLGLPFDRGAAIDFKAYNGKSGFIGSFDKQMEGMDKVNQKIITPIFPSSYKTKSLTSKLVKFVIKVNDMKHRKTINAQFLVVMQLKNLEGEKIQTLNDYNNYIESLFKAQLLEELANDYLAKADAKMPYVLIESIYSQTYIDLMKRTRKRPDPKTVLRQAQHRAKVSSIIDEFFKVNAIHGHNFETKRSNLIDEIYVQLPD